MDSSSFSTNGQQHGESEETGGESFEMPKFNMENYDTSGLMGDLSLSRSPGIPRNYEESNLLDDDSYELEMRQARHRNGAEDEDVSVVDNAGAQEGEEDQTMMRVADAPAEMSSGERISNAHGARGTASSPGDAQREERLQATLFELKKMNDVFENYANALEASRHHNAVGAGSSNWDSCLYIASFLETSPTHSSDIATTRSICRSSQPDRAHTALNPGQEMDRSNRRKCMISLIWQRKR